MRIISIFFKIIWDRIFKYSNKKNFSLSLLGYWLTFKVILIIHYQTEEKCKKKKRKENDDVNENDEVRDGWPLHLMVWPTVLDMALRTKMNEWWEVSFCFLWGKRWFREGYLWVREGRRKMRKGEPENRVTRGIARYSRLRHIEIEWPLLALSVFCFVYNSVSGFWSLPSTLRLWIPYTSPRNFDRG